MRLNPSNVNPNKERAQFSDTEDKGLKPGLSMGEARLRPLKSTGRESEQADEQRDHWRCALSRGRAEVKPVTNS